MPTVIDSLLVTLGLDSSGFSSGTSVVGKGLKELEDKAKAAQKALQDAITNGADASTLEALADAANEAAASLGKVQRAAKVQSQETAALTKVTAQFLAVIGGTMVIKKFIADTIESSAALGRLSENLQTNVSTISAWSNATELAGGSATGLQGTMDMLSRSQTELTLTGQSSLIPYFSALGVSMADATGKARPLDDILLDLATKFSKMDRTTANNMGRMMGIDQGTLQLLLKGREEVENMINAQKAFGAVNKDQAEEAMRLERSIKEVQQTFAGFGRELLHKAMPAIEAVMGAMISLTDWAKRNSTFVIAFLTALTASLVGLAVATSPITLTVLALVGLSAAIAELYDGYQKWISGSGSTGLIDWNRWGPGIQGAIKGIRWIKDLLGDLIYRAIAAAGAIGAVLSGDWQGAKIAAKEFVSGNGTSYGADEAPEVKLLPKEKETPAVSPGSKVKYDSRQESTALPASPGGINNATPKGKTEVTQAEQDAVGFFRKLGWTLEQSAGIVANIKKESGFNSKAVGDGGKAFGLAQWHPDRQADFQKQFGKPIREATKEEQMMFIHHELTAGKEKRAGDKLRQAGTAEQAAGVVSTHYERPAATAKEAYERGQMAKGIANKARSEPAPQVTVNAPAPAAVTPQPAAKAPAITEAKKPESVSRADWIANPRPAVEVPKAKEQELPLFKKYDQQPQGQAPATDANTSLLQGLAKAITTMMQFMLSQAENKKPGVPDVKGIQDKQSVYNGIPGASTAAQGVGAGQVARNAQASTVVPPASNSSSVETNIAKIEVHTAATDAQGMAKDLANSNNWSFLSQANFGLR